jgi:hypothetical protein
MPNMPSSTRNGDDRNAKPYFKMDKTNNKVSISQDNKTRTISTEEETKN